MTRGTFSPDRWNKTLLVMTFVVTAVFLLLAALLGVFSASPQAGSTSDEQITAAVEEALQNEAESTPQMSAEEQRARALNGTAESEAEITLSDLKLQEVRDTYLRFEQAIPGVSVHYSDQGQCAGEQACVENSGSQQILVSQAWALKASPTDMAIVLANAHADLAIQTLWGSEQAADSELQAIIPACSVVQNEAVLEAAGVNVPTQTNASVAAMKEIIVDEMVGTEAEDPIYPRAMRTEYQLTAADQIAHIKQPDVVVPVSSPSCG